MTARDAAPTPEGMTLGAEEIERLLSEHRFTVHRDAEPIFDDKPWRMTRAVWGCTCGWVGDDADLRDEQVPGDLVRTHRAEQIAARLAAERAAHEALLNEVAGMAGRQATAAHARGDQEERRRWLDLMIVLERAALDAPDVTY